jgi:hypothetical protein
LAPRIRTDGTKIGVDGNHGTPVDARPTEHPGHLLAWRRVEEAKEDNNDDGTDLQKRSGTDTERLQNHVGEEVVCRPGKILGQNLWGADRVVDKPLDSCSDTSGYGNYQEQLNEDESKVEVLHKKLSLSGGGRTGESS